MNWGASGNIDSHLPVPVIHEWMQPKTTNFYQPLPNIVWWPCQTYNWLEHNWQDRQERICKGLCQYEPIYFLYPLFQSLCELKKIAFNWLYFYCVHSCANQPQSITAVVNLLINSVIFFATLALPPLKETRKSPEALKPFKPSSPPKEVRTIATVDHWNLRWCLSFTNHQTFSKICGSEPHNYTYRGMHQNSHMYFDFPTPKGLKFTPSTVK